MRVPLLLQCVGLTRYRITARNQIACKVGRESAERERKREETEASSRGKEKDSGKRERDALLSPRREKWEKERIVISRGNTLG